MLLSFLFIERWIVLPAFVSQALCEAAQARQLSRFVQSTESTSFTGNINGNKVLSWYHQYLIVFQIFPTCAWDDPPIYEHHFCDGWPNSISGPAFGMTDSPLTQVVWINWDQPCWPNKNQQCGRTNPLISIEKPWQKIIKNQMVCQNQAWNVSDDCFILFHTVSQR